MGCPVSLIVCNVYIEDFQGQVLKSAAHPSCWFCTDNLNCIYDDIKWTTEGEVSIHRLRNEQVNISTRTETPQAFMDTWSVINDDDGSLKCTLRDSYEPVFTF